MSSIDEIKARLDIVDLVSETVQLRRSGKSYTGFCPFHANTRTPAFVVFPESGTWRCFGQCNEGGDIFRFVMKKEGWDFPEALRYLADKAGVQLKAPSAEEQAAAEEHDHLRALLEEAVTYYRHQLLNTSAGKPVLDYLHEKRGLSDATIESFGLGYAPASWEAALHYFKSRGYSQPEILEAGLATERQRDASPADESQSGQERGVYDRFRHRLMIPIRDERGRIAGFGARVINPDDVPKFLNSPQTPVFDKGRLLYGLDRARKSIRSIDQAIIVEGYLDVIALHQAGFTNVVSPMGTALTEHQMYLLKRFSHRIVLALDPDAAGNQATLRGLQVARQAMDREKELIFDARGLLGYEARLQADLRVTTLPEGMDPDEVVNRDPQEWEQIVARAKPVVIHVMETLAIGQDLDDPKVKTEIANQVIPLIQDVANPIERDTYRQRLARLLRVDERSLIQATPSAPRPRPNLRRPTPGSPVEAPVQETLQAQQASSYSLESHCMGLLLRRPDLLYKIDRYLVENKLGRLSTEDFQHADHEAIFRLLQESIDQDIAEPLNFIMNSLSLPMMEVADHLLSLTAKLDPNDDRVLDDLLRALLHLRKRHVNQDIDYRRILFEEAQEAGDLKGQQYTRTLQEYLQVMQRLDRALGKLSSRTINPK